MLLKNIMKQFMKEVKIKVSSNVYFPGLFSVCKRKEEEPPQQQTKKPRLVFTDLQRRTLQAIFKVLKIYQKAFCDS